MDSEYMFEKELNKLRENEDYIESFREIFLKEINNTNQYKYKIDKLLKFSKDNNLVRSEAWGYYFLGWHNIDICEYEKAVNNFFTSYDLFDKLNNKFELAYACNGLTNVYCQMGQFNLAHEWGLKGISLCEETSNNEAMIILLINTGINYVQMEYYDKAREIFDCINRMEQKLTVSQKVSCMLPIAEIEINIGNPNTALKIIDEALKIESVNHINADISEMSKLKGMAYVKLGNFELAEKEFRYSYNISKKHGLFYEECSTMLKWSNLYLINEKHQEAIDLLNEVINICSSNKFNVILREAYYLLYIIYKEQNTTNLALEYLEKYLIVDDEMYDYEQNQLMAKMNFKNIKRIAEQYKQLYDKTELLSTIGQKIISNLNINSIIKIIDDEINYLIDADYYGIAVYDKENDQSTYYYIKDDLELHKTVQYNNSEGSLGEYCIKNKKDVIIGNEMKEYRKYINTLPKVIEGFSDDNNISSVIYTPMIINDKVVGLMTAQSKKENLYDMNDLHTLKILANYTAIAVENAISYKKIEDRATYDHLTKFKTKTEILKLGDIIYEKYTKSKLKFSVIMMDLDNFKIVNDTYGHIYGDKALSLVAESITKCIRNTDYIGRFGGDEFLLICPDTGLKEAMDVAERIRTTIGSKLFVLGDGVNIYLTLSLGVHECNEKDNSFTDIVKGADKCLYRAKKTERNIVICR
jgi:diguanylate cyclase (GGDEF)-like protein